MKSVANVDIYTRVHKGLRKALFELSVAAGNTTYTDENALQDLISKGKEVFEFLKVHGAVEDNFQLPLIEQKVPGSSHVDTEDHHRIEQQIEKLEQQMMDLTSAADKESAGYNFYLSVNGFISDYLVHMYNEEVYTTKIFLENCTVEEILGTITQINAFTTPAQKAMSLKYIFPATAPHERVIFLDGVRAVNVQAFLAMKAIAKQSLSAEEYNALDAALEESPVAQ